MACPLKALRTGGIIACLTMLSMSACAYAREELKEEQVKAAFVLNFAKFVEWPASTFSSNNVLDLCVVGKNKIGSTLKLLHQREVQGHVLKVSYITSPEELGDYACHILFIGEDEPKRQQQWLIKVQNRAILTIADDASFMKQGGMIGLYTEDSRVQFMINQKTTQETGLKISARMLQLAREPRE